VTRASSGAAIGVAGKDADPKEGASLSRVEDAARRVEGKPDEAGVA
jgi:hypothetical protein